MKRVDPARARVSARHGVGDVAGLEGGGDIGSQVGPAAFDGSVLSFRSAIHLHGSTPHRESGVVSGARAGDMRRSPTGQARPHASPVTVTGRCSNGWRGRVHRHRVPARHQQGLRRASRSARRRTPAGRRHRLYERSPPSRNLAGHGQPDSRIRPSGQVTTATPFAPEELAIRKGHREPAVDPVARRASTHRRRKRRRSRVVSGGVASALDVAPFHDPRFLACCPWG